MPAPSYSLGYLAKYVNGTLVGSKDYQVTGLATLQSATNDKLTFLTNKKYKQKLKHTRAGCVLLESSDAEFFAGNKILSENPYLSYARLTELFLPTIETKPCIHPSALVDNRASVGEGVDIAANVVVEADCVIGNNVRIYPGCYIGEGVTIGSGTIIYANVSVYHHVTIGDRCIIHSGSVLGSDGFGFAPMPERSWKKIHQLGSVEIGHAVEVGACTTIDRGALENTVIGDGVKIDNHVQIAHNVQIGENTAIAAAVAIAGSAEIGKRCTIAGAVGIVGHITIVDDVHITAMTCVTKSISKAGSYSSGVPMNTTEQWRKNAARFNQLNRLAKQLLTNN